MPGFRNLESFTQPLPACHLRRLCGETLIQAIEFGRILRVGAEHVEITAVCSERLLDVPSCPIRPSRLTRFLLVSPRSTPRAHAAGRGGAR